MNNRFIASCLLTLGFTTAFAGSMGAVEPAIDFNGLYFGLGSGFTSLFQNSTGITTSTDALLDTSSGHRHNNDTVLFTGEVGYGKMIQEKTYVGVKGAVYYSPYQFSLENNYVQSGYTTLSTDTTSKISSMQPTYNVDLVLGYEIFPHVLPFVEGGVSFSNPRYKQLNHVSRTDIAANTTVNYDSALNLDRYNTSFNVGIGADFLIQRNWFLFSELLYTDMGRTSSSVITAVPGSNPAATEHRSVSTTVNAVSLFAGVSYLFPI